MNSLMQRSRCMPSAISRSRAVSVMAVQDVKGTVVSTSMNKTVVVAVESIAPHPTFFKRVRKTRRIFAHTETSELGVGDYVRLEGCRPLSKNKRFAVAEVIRKSQ